MRHVLSIKENFALNSVVLYLAWYYLREWSLIKVIRK